MTPLFEAYYQADAFGKAIFFLLFILSITSWFVLIQKVWLLRTVSSFAKQVRESFLSNNNNPLALDYVPKSTEWANPFLELHKTLKQRTMEILNKNRWYQESKGATEQEGTFLTSSDIELVDAHLSMEMDNHLKVLESNTFILPTVMSLAPFLGLLGTVWGILLTFSELQTNAGGGLSQTVLGGLAMALGTTVLGLVVAIPALIGVFYLRHAIRQFQVEMEDFSHMMLASVEMHYRRVD